MRRPLGVVFDAVGTLFDVEALAGTLGELGLPAEAASRWLARTLRDGLASEIAGDIAPMREVGAFALEAMLVEAGRGPDGGAIPRVLDALGELPPYGDVEGAIGLLEREAIPLALLSTLDADTTARLLDRAGLRGRIAHVVSQDEVGHWKPHRATYRRAARALGAPRGRIAMVSAHGWDLAGAAAAGLATAWVRRGEQLASGAAVDARAESLDDLSRQLVAAGRRRRLPAVPPAPVEPAEVPGETGPAEG